MGGGRRKTRSPDPLNSVGSVRAGRIRKEVDGQGRSGGAFQGVADDGVRPTMLACRGGSTVNLRRSLVAIMCAFALVSGSYSLAFAQATNTDTVTATLAGGVVTFTIDVTTNLSPQAYSHESGYTN